MRPELLKKMISGGLALSKGDMETSAAILRDLRELELSVGEASRFESLERSYRLRSQNPVDFACSRRSNGESHQDPIDAALLALSEEIARGAKKPKPAHPTVSVIIPCFNSVSYIAPCLESLARQTLPQEEFEVICIDDCSTDNTAGFIGEYSGQIRNLRIIRHQTNSKQGAARNTGITHAKGKYVFFVDSDDFLRLDALEVLLNLVGECEVAVCQHIKTRFDSNSQRAVSNRRSNEGLLPAVAKNMLGWWPFGILISRDLLVRTGIRFREGVFFEDIDFCTKVFLAAESHTVTREALYYYIERDCSTVNSINAKKLADSASAIAAAYSVVADSLAESHRPGFLTNSENWLKLQARRLRESAPDPEVRSRLAEGFIGNLQEYGVLDFLLEGARDRIMETVMQEEETSDAPKLSGKYSPWSSDFRDEFKGRVIFFCEVNYHIRSAAPIARKLRNMGIESIVVDATRSSIFSSNRPLSDEELPEFADIDLRPFDVGETPPFATDAAAFVFMNDITYTKQLIFENFGFDVPTFGFYEGINDDWNLDRSALRMPYRSVHHLLLPGIYQKGFYMDRECHVVGLPNVQNRLKDKYAPPSARRAVINVNFTYGVLEDRRMEFVDTAVRACREIGLDYVITQHPADKADLSAYQVGTESVYDLLADGAILISRFSTTILESLAMGRPAVYHNPIGELVPKFKNPLGAFRVTTGVDDLKEALLSELDWVKSGGDVRKRAALFLRFHCHAGSQKNPEDLAARTIAAVVKDPTTRFAFKVNPA